MDYIYCEIHIVTGSVRQLAESGKVMPVGAMV